MVDMSYKTNLVFALEQEKVIPGRGYEKATREQVLDKVPYETFMSRLFEACLLGDAKRLRQHHIFMELNNSKSLFKKEKYILVMDCDSDGHKEAAEMYIENYTNLDYMCFESSPNHYWFLCDYIESISSVLKKQEEIPGNDPLYFQFASKRKYLNLRAYHKRGWIPTIVSQKIMRGRTSNEFVGWVNDFIDFWHSDDMRYMLKTLSSTLDPIALSNLGLSYDQQTSQVLQQKVFPDKLEEEVEHCMDRIEV